MAEAFWWGLLAGSSLILGGLLSLWFRLADRWIGHIMAFGGGVLISAVAFELVEDGHPDGGRNPRGGGRPLRGQPRLLLRRHPHRPDGRRRP